MTGDKKPPTPDDDYRRAFELTADEARDLGEAIVADGDDPGRSYVNAFWMQAGIRYGFCWTTVADVAGAVCLSGGEPATGTDRVTFTAEVEQMPARDNRAAAGVVIDLLGGMPAPEPGVDENEESYAGRIGAWAAGLAVEAWHAGHGSGLTVGEGIGRMTATERHGGGDLAVMTVIANDIVKRWDAGSVPGPDDWPNVARVIVQLVDYAVEAETRAAGLKQTFDMQWDATMRAIKRWQAGDPDPFVRSLVEAASAVIAAQHDGECLLAGFPELAEALDRMPASFSVRAGARDLMWPDGADLVVWLLRQIEAAESVPAASPIADAERAADRLDSVWLFVGPELARRTSDAIDALVAYALSQTMKIAILTERLRGVEGQAVILAKDPAWVPATDSRERHVRRPAVEGLECTRVPGHRPDCECAECFPLVHATGQHFEGDER